MNKRIYIKLLLLTFYLFLGSTSVFAQTQTDSTSNTTIYVENSDNTIVKKEGDIYVKYLNGNVRIIHDTTFFYCDTAILKDNDLMAFGNVVILQKDSTSLFSDTLFYNGDSLKANLTGRVLLIHNDKQLKTNRLEYDVDKKIALYKQNGQVFQDSTILKSKKGIYKLREDMIYFKDYVSIVDSSFKMKADSLKYHAGHRKAFFTGPTLIQQDSSTIYCEAGYYDIENNKAVFRQNPKYEENDKRAVAHQIQFVGEDEVFILAGKAHYSDKEQDVKADTIKYYKDLEQSIMIGNVHILSDGNMVEGSYIIFNHDSGDFISEGRSRLSDDEYVITADYLDLKDEEGKGFASGNIILEDTLALTTIYCDKLHTDKENSSFIAYNDSINRPLMEKIMDNDTLFLAADTLYSYEKVEGPDSFQILEAYFDVRIYQKEFQAKADSMSFNSRDSVFVLLNDPVMWSDTSQFSGDTISIYMKNEKIDRLFLRQNAKILNQEADIFFNQIGSRTINAYFESDTLKSMKTKGNAESIYYLKDDSGAFLGVLKTVCSRMDYHFAQNDLQSVKYYEEPVSKMTGIKQEINNPQRLSGFRWIPEKRPLDRNVHFKEFILPLPEEPDLSGLEEQGVNDIDIKNESSEKEKVEEENLEEENLEEGGTDEEKDGEDLGKGVEKEIIEKEQIEKSNESENN